MKGKLIKTEHLYCLEINEKITATTSKSNDELEFPQRLSVENCDELFGVVDVEKLAEEETRKYLPGCPENIMNFIAHKRFFKIAFEQAMELYQPTEIEVEVEMDRIPADLAPGGWDVFPKLDENGCLILKRVE